jgi:hypothetical protein
VQQWEPIVVNPIIIVIPSVISAVAVVPIVIVVPIVSYSYVIVTLVLVFAGFGTPLPLPSQVRSSCPQKDWDCSGRALPPMG